MNNKTIALSTVSLSLASFLQVCAAETAGQSLAALPPSTVVPLSPGPSNSSSAPDGAPAHLKAHQNAPTHTNASPGRAKVSRSQGKSSSERANGSREHDAAQPGSASTSSAPAAVVSPTAPGSTSQAPLVNPSVPVASPPAAQPTIIRFGPQSTPGSSIIITSPTSGYRPTPAQIMHLGQYAYNRRRSSESEDELRRELDLTLKTQGPRSALAAEQTCDLIDCYIDKGSFDLTHPLIDQLMANYTKLPSDDQHFLAARLIDQSSWLERAPHCALQAHMLTSCVLLSLNKANWVDASGELGSKLIALGNTYTNSQRYLQAEPVMKAAVALADRSPSNRSVALAHCSLAQIYERLTRYNDAEKEYRSALQLSYVSRSTINSGYSHTLVQLCALFLTTANKAKLQALMPQLVSAAREASLNDRYNFDSCVSQLLAHGYSAEAEQLADAEIEALSQHLSDSPNNVLLNLRSSINAWAQNFANTGHDDAAERLCDHWVTVTEQIFGPTFETANTYLFAAKFLIDHDRSDKARELIKKALPLGNKLHDATYVTALIDCGNSFRNKNQNADAERIYVNALEIANLDDRINVQLSLGSLYDQNGDGAKAAALQDAVASEVNDQVLNGVPGIDLSIKQLVADSLKQMNFRDAQQFLAQLRIRAGQNSRRRDDPDQTSSVSAIIDVIVQTDERRGDFVKAAQIYKREVDLVASSANATNKSAIYIRYARLLRNAGDEAGADSWEGRARAATDPPATSPN